LSPQNPESPVIKPPPKRLGRLLEAAGHQIFYLTLRLGGLNLAYALLLPVIFFYCATSRKIHRLTAPYVRRRFPKAGPLGRWLATTRIVHSFGRVLVERAWLGMVPGAALEGRIQGLEKLAKALEGKRGIILLTAHVGNWQSALSNIDALPRKINSLMHHQEGYVAKHFFELQGQKCPFNIINIDGFMGGMVESAAALTRGEIVTIMGDRVVGGASIELDFFGDKARFPISAYALAAKTGAHVAVMLAAKVGKKGYLLEITEVLQPTYESRESRSRELERAARVFSASLESYLQKNPYQWYNFYDFWDKQNA